MKENNQAGLPVSTESTNTRWWPSEGGENVCAKSTAGNGHKIEPSAQVGGNTIPREFNLIWTMLNFSL